MILPGLQLQFVSKTFSIGQTGLQPVKLIVPEPLDIWQAIILFREVGYVVPVGIENKIGTRGFLAQAYDDVGRFWMIVISSSGGVPHHIAGDDILCKVQWDINVPVVTSVEPLGETDSPSPILTTLHATTGYYEPEILIPAEIKFAYPETPDPIGGQQ